MPVVKITNERIPPGRYWADVLEKNRVAFDGWLDAVTKAKLAQLDHVEQFETRAFVIFTVTAETGAPWPEDSDLPSPNLASGSVNSSEDTVSRPDPEKDITDQISDNIGSLKTSVFWLGAIVAVGVAISSLKRR